ncbi:MAG: PEGA domain-containing protein [Deltaproteobacteria bacterium]|nr:PEGA domain-containing protein [Deltaproteobacteria bacterium]
MNRLKVLALLAVLAMVFSGSTAAGQESGPLKILVLDPESRFFKSKKLNDLGNHLRSLAARYPSLSVLKVPGMSVKQLRAKARCRGSKPDCLVKIARLVKAHRVLHSEIQKLPGRYLIIMRMVDSKTSGVVEQTRVRSRKDIESVRNALLRGWVDLQGPLVRSQMKVTSNVTGAEIFLDGRKIGRTPLVLMKDLSKGTHIVELRHPGYRNAKQKVEVGTGSGLKVDVKLEKLVAQVEDPVSATKLGSGKDEPIDSAEPALAPVGHKLVDTKEPTKDTKVLAPKEPLKDVAISLDKPYVPTNDENRGTDPEPTMTSSSPLYKKWWFWTAIGVVVAGGVTGLAVGLTSGGSSIPDGRGRVAIEFW